MKSARNPLTKKLPTAIRRVKSEVQLSRKNANATSEMDMDALCETGVDEHFLTTHSDVKTADWQFAGEVTECLPQDSQQVILFSNSRVNSSFQSEFLKMLSQTDSEMPVGMNCWPKRLKPDSRLVLKSKVMRRPVALKKLAARAAKSYGFSLPASSVCTGTGSQQTAKKVKGCLEGDMKSVTSGYAETSSLDCNAATHASGAQLDSKLISSNINETERYIAADVCPSVEKPDGSLSLSAAETSASCEAVGHYNGKSSVRSDVSPPVLSLPDDPVNDGTWPQNSHDETPPVLEPSYQASGACMETVSEFVGADVSISSSVHERRTLLKLLTSTDSELRSMERHSTGTGVMDIEDGSSVSTSVVRSVHSPTCSTSPLTSCGAAPPISTAAASAQLQYAVNSAERKPTSSSNFSALARFRPTLPASSLLPPVDRVRRPMPPHTRPYLRNPSLFRR